MMPMLSDPAGYAPTLPYFTERETPVFYDAPGVDMGGETAPDPEDFEITEDDADELALDYEAMVEYYSMTPGERRDFYGH